MVLKYIMMRNYEYAKNIPTHSHDFYEFVYYLEGSGISAYEGTSFEFGPGDYLFINPNVPHSEQHVTRPRVVCLAFQAEPFGLTTRHYHDDGHILPYVQRIAAEYQGKQIYYSDMIKSLIQEIVITLQRQDEPKTASNAHLTPVIDYINAYYMTHLDIDELARQCGYSPDHFRRLFKKETGANPKEYILNLRLEQAKKLLSSTTDSLQSIATNCGFEYYSQFSLFFKKYVHHNPTDFRSRFQKQPQD